MGVANGNGIRTNVAISIGMVLGITMPANVWMIIWKNRRVVLANAVNVLEGKEADPNAATDILPGTHPWDEGRAADAIADRGGPGLVPALIPDGPPSLPHANLDKPARPTGILPPPHAPTRHH